MAEIKICGLYVNIDDEDVERVLSRSWSLVESIAGPKLLSRDRGKRCTLERFIMQTPAGFTTERLPERSRNDYRKEALRIGLLGERMIKTGKSKRTLSSRYKGVSFDSKSGNWRAGIRPHGLSIYLGSFATETEAALAYNEAARVHFGENAFQNDVAVSNRSSKDSADAS